MQDGVLSKCTDTATKRGAVKPLREGTQFSRLCIYIYPPTRRRVGILNSKANRFEAKRFESEAIRSEANSSKRFESEATKRSDSKAKRFESEASSRSEALTKARKFCLGVPGGVGTSRDLPGPPGTSQAPPAQKDPLLRGPRKITVLLYVSRNIQHLTPWTHLKFIKT